MYSNEADIFSSGMVAIVGPPNAGKSTLMNRLLGQKISIVTPKAQTTRNRILGVLSSQKDQIVFVDTPGLHESDSMLNREMVRIAIESLEDVEVVVFLVDSRQLAVRDEVLDEQFTRYLGKKRVPVFLVLNKIDLLKKGKVLAIIDKYRKVYPFHTILPLSAKNGDNVDTLLDEIRKVLPPGPQYFPDDMPTDATERFLVAEIIREKVFLLTGQEIPYSTAVVIDLFDENTRKITIHATIVIERNSQKGIVIGKGGHKLKSIGIAARKDIEKMLGEQVVLKLWVKVKKNWSENDIFLRELGFR